MLEQIFKTIFLTSCIGATLTIFLTLIKPITKKCFSSRWHYYIWLVVLMVMILPVRFNLPERTIQPEPGLATVYVTPEERSEEVNSIRSERQDRISSVISENLSVGTEAVKEMAVDKIHIVSLIWLIGVIALLFIKLTGYSVFLRKMHRDTKIISCPEIKRFTDRKVMVRMSDSICSPLMTGLFKPTLLLPKEALNLEQLDNVLAHEITHFKRKDILYKWFACIVKCIHWFNPSVYFVERQINTECEISCDLAVVDKMNREEEFSYINTILSLLSAGKMKDIPLTTGMTGSKKTLKKRFTMIKKKRRIGKIAAIISVIAAIAILVGGVFASGVLNGKRDEVSEDIGVNIYTDEATSNRSNFLILGVDENQKTNYIMLFSLDREGKVIAGMSIPKEISAENNGEMVQISEYKMNADGVQNVMDIIRHKLGIPIHYYAMLDSDSVDYVIQNFGETSNIWYDGVYAEDDVSIYTLNRERLDGTLSLLSSISHEQEDFAGLEELVHFLSLLTDKVRTNYSFENIHKDIEYVVQADYLAFCNAPIENVSYEDGTFYDIDEEKAQSIIEKYFID